MLRHRKAKVVATIGPSSQSEEMLQKLFETGVDVFRLNFSHGTHEDKAELVRKIRKLEQNYHQPIGILADLQGPKFRIGKFKNGPVELVAGQSFVLDTSSEPGDQTRVELPHPIIFENIKSGDHLLLNDGNVKLSVDSVTNEQIKTTVVYGDELNDNKGVNLPQTLLPLSALTEKDREDLDFILTQEIDWVALSFVQTAEDITQLKSLVASGVKVMAKIEKPSAVSGLGDIIDVADSIMIARGDLGVEMPCETVPVITKRIIRECRQQGKPVLVATQMLESMIESPVPTRAEASDVATAIYDGADAVMLSAETAAGKYPLEAVSTMHSIIKSTEEDSTYRSNMALLSPQRNVSSEDAICASLSLIAEQLDIVAAITYTSSGATSLRAARERPDAMIVSVTESLRVARQMTLVWGVLSLHIEDQPDRVADVIRSANNIFKKFGIGASGDQIVITAGMPFGVPGTTNFLRIAQID